MDIQNKDINLYFIYFIILSDGVCFLGDRLKTINCRIRVPIVSVKIFRPNIVCQRQNYYI